MLNYKKPLIFDIQKIIRNENTKETDINNIERDLNLRKRSPWTKEVRININLQFFRKTMLLFAW